MSDIEGLKDRVEQAVQQLSSVQGARQGQNQNLTSLLGNLEKKFQSRTVELDYCNSQIEMLIQDNAHLSELLERLIHLIESERVSGEDDPLIRASTMAATLLQNWSAPEEPGDEAAEMPEAFGPPQLAPEAPELVSQDSLSDSFEDVSAEELEAEALDGLDVEIPELVAVAIAAAQETDVDDFDVSVADDAVAVEEVAEEVVEDDMMGEPVAVDLDIPDSEDLSDDGLADEIEEDTEASIRAMMARLEAAALDAKFSSEENSKEGPSASVQVA